jgi:hypothetical protein
MSPFNQDGSFIYYDNNAANGNANATADVINKVR